MFTATEGRWGSREVEVTAVTLVGADGAAGHVFHTGDPLTVRIGFRAPPADARLRLRLRHLQRRRRVLLRHQYQSRGAEPERLSGEGEVRFVVDRLDLVEGTYKFDVAVHKLDGFPYDYHRQLYTIPRQGAAEGRRHLPAAASLGVHAGTSSSRTGARG